MTKTEELLALADALEQIINGKYQTPVAKFIADTNKAAAALREYAGMLDAEPVAWMYLYRRHDGTVIRRMEGGRWNGDDAFEQVPLYTHPPAPTQREHITDGSPCWCSPDLDYVDPETGAKVWIHKNIQ